MKISIHSSGLLALGVSIVIGATRLSQAQEAGAPAQALPAPGGAQTECLSPPSHPLFQSGDGGKKPFVICNAQQLNKIGTLGPEYLNKNYVLRNDIDLSEISGNFNTIGSYDRPFTGTFEGSNRTIRNLHIDNENGVQVGMFGSICSPYRSSGSIISQVRNLAFRNPMVKGMDSVGVVAGQILDTCAGGQTNAGNVLVSNINVFSGEVSGRYLVGGLFGYAQGVTGYMLYNQATISGKSRVGGIAGEWATGKKMELVDSDATISASSIVGGLFGTAGKPGGELASRIYHSRASGVVQVTQADNWDGRVGGMVGELLSSALIQESISNAKVKGQRSVGGLVGLLFGGRILNSYATGDVEGIRCTIAVNPRYCNILIGGLVGSMASVTPKMIQSSYASGKVSGEKWTASLVGASEDQKLYANPYAYIYESSGLTNISMISYTISPNVMIPNRSIPGPHWDMSGVWKKEGKRLELRWASPGEAPAAPSTSEAGPD